MPRKRISRRAFLKSAAGSLVAAPWVVPSSALGRDGQLPPSDRIGMGFIGLGGRGGGIMRYFVQEGRSQCIAVCDVWETRREAARKRMGGQCAAYNDFRDLLDRGDIDAVVIATPDHWHVLHSIAAMKAGKDVYCEKPLSLTVREGRALVGAAERYGRVFLHGTHQRSFWGFRHACELARNGYLGEVHTIRVCERGGRADGPRRPEPVPKTLDYDLWLGQAPEIPYVHQPDSGGAWQFRSDYTIGWVAGCGVHPMDIAQWGNGTERTGPVEIEGRGEYPADGFNDTLLWWHVECTYANGVKLIFKSTDKGLRHHEVGARFEGTEGWSFAYGNAFSADAHPKSLMKVTIPPDGIHLRRSDNHSLHFLDCVRTRSETVAPAEVAHRSTTICHLSDIAIRLGRRLRWDPQREQFLNDDQANRMLGGAMRSPWRL
ncbi:MAG: Gfo/Idh/MocA family oxidoreductase [Phycisphaerae bacterium]